MSRTLSIRRGSLTLLDASEAWPTLAPEFPRARWDERVLSADGDASAEGPRAGFFRNVCQTASGGSYAVFLGGRFEPAASPTLTVRVAVGTAEGAMDPTLSSAVLLGAARALEGATRPGGVLTLDRGVIHLVDCKHWAFRGAGAALARALCERFADDEALVAAIETEFFVNSRSG